MDKDWISVDDKMPEIIHHVTRSEKVLVAINLGSKRDWEINVAWCYNCSGSPSFKNPNIKYWMPLPMNPREQEIFRKTTNKNDDDKWLYIRAFTETKTKLDELADCLDIITYEVADKLTAICSYFFELSHAIDNIEKYDKFELISRLHCKNKKELKMKLHITGGHISEMFWHFDEIGKLTQYKSSVYTEQGEFFQDLFNRFNEIFTSKCLTESERQEFEINLSFMNYIRQEKENNKPV